MAVLNIVLRNFALVDFHLLLQEIHGEFLLQSGITTVFLVLQDALNGGGLPLLFTSRSGDALRSQNLTNSVWGFALHEHLVYR